LNLEIIIFINSMALPDDRATLTKPHF